MRIFWINAYQLYIWNNAAFEHIIKYGTKVVVGDLYFPSNNYYSNDTKEEKEAVIDEKSKDRPIIVKEKLPCTCYGVNLHPVSAAFIGKSNNEAKMINAKNRTYLIIADGIIFHEKNFSWIVVMRGFAVDTFFVFFVDSLRGFAPNWE